MDTKLRHIFIIKVEDEVAGLEQMYLLQSRRLFQDTYSTIFKWRDESFDCGLLGHIFDELIEERVFKKDMCEISGMQKRMNDRCNKEKEDEVKKINNQKEQSLSKSVSSYEDDMNNNIKIINDRHIKEKEDKIKIYNNKRKESSSSSVSSCEGDNNNTNKRNIVNNND